MCKRHETCDTLPVGVGACEETCLLRETNLDFTAGKTCGDRFVEFVSCLAQASCDDLGAMSSAGSTPPSCAEAESALNAACS
jgi:hypothetical protein